jgi:hypothetical protein
MTASETIQSQDYAQAVAAIIAVMPPERAEQVYEFARFLQARKAAPSPIGEEIDDWRNDSEDQMQAEDAIWDAAYARHKDNFPALRETARAVSEAGATEYDRMLVG